MPLKSWKCERCGVEFNTKRDLTHHMHVHAGETRVKCARCRQFYEPTPLGQAVHQTCSRKG